PRLHPAHHRHAGAEVQARFPRRRARRRLRSVSAPWPATEEALVALQRDLAAARPPPWRPLRDAPAVGGCFVCFERGGGGRGAAGDPGWAAAVVLFADDVRTTVVAGAAPAPYVPGLP